MTLLYCISTCEINSHRYQYFAKLILPTIIDFVVCKNDLIGAQIEHTSCSSWFRKVQALKRKFIDMCSEIAYGSLWNQNQCSPIFLLWYVAHTIRCDSFSKFLPNIFLNLYDVSTTFVLHLCLYLKLALKSTRSVCNPDCEYILWTGYTSPNFIIQFNSSMHLFPLLPAFAKHNTVPWQIHVLSSNKKQIVKLIYN